MPQKVWSLHQRRQLEPGMTSLAFTTLLSANAGAPYTLEKNQKAAILLLNLAQALLNLPHHVKHPAAAATEVAMVSLSTRMQLALGNFHCDARMMHLDGLHADVATLLLLISGPTIIAHPPRKFKISAANWNRLQYRCKQELELLRRIGHSPRCNCSLPLAGVSHGPAAHKNGAAVQTEHRCEICAGMLSGSSLYRWGPRCPCTQVLCAER